MSRLHLDKKSTAIDYIIYEFMNLKKIIITSVFISISLQISSCTSPKQIEKNNLISRTEINVDQKMDTLKKTIQVPTFPDKKYIATKFGLNIHNSAIDNTIILNKLIERCNHDGGGKIIIQKGKYNIAKIHLLSNVNLHLEKGVELKFSTSPEDYLPVVKTSFEGNELMNYSPLIYAYQQENIAITGEGVLNGQANNENWWPWVGAEQYGYINGQPKYTDPGNRDRLIEMSNNNTPVEKRIFGQDHYFRPAFIQTVESKKILIDGIKIINAPFWIIHPFKSSHVTVNNVNIEIHGPNNDGCNPEYSSYIRISNSTFNTGDDCIAIKSGRNDEGRRVNIPSENILIENCKMIDGHGGVVIGSEISAGVRNIFVRNCVMNSPNLERAIRIKTNSIRGGFVEDVYVKNLDVIEVEEAVLKINTFYGFYGEPEGPYIPSIRNIYLENIRVKNGGKYAVMIDGRPQKPVSNVVLKDFYVEKVKEAFKISDSEPIKFRNTQINGIKY